MKTTTTDVTSNSTEVEYNGEVFTKEDFAEMRERKKAREALGDIHKVIPTIATMCMKLNAWVYGEKTAWGKPSKKAGQKGSMYQVDAEKFSQLFNGCLPAGCNYHFVPRGSKNEIITLEHIDGKTPLVDGHVYN